MGYNDSLEEQMIYLMEPALRVASDGYGIQFQANSDGVFFGLDQYTSGHYRPYISWGDDTGDTPFSIRFNNAVKFEFSYDGLYATKYSLW